MSVQFNARVFREYDIRGKAEADLGDAFVTALGQAYGTFVRRRGGTRVALGRDCRVSGPRLFSAFSAGIRAAGVGVVDIGIVPTPVLYWSLFHLPVDGGTIITGSHNPGDENGFKLCVGRTSIYGADIQTLRTLIETGDVEQGAGGLETHDVLDAYLDDLAARLVPARPLKVVVDAGNGMGGLTAGRLYRRLGHEVVELYCDLDGSFPNHHPDPTVEANLVDLVAAVAAHGADLGIAFDGDADRVGAVDARGRVVWGDELLTLFASERARSHPGEALRVVCEVKCSQVVNLVLEPLGVHVETWKVGHSLIKARMKETGALIAGEMSGHLFFGDEFYGFDDAVYGGARLLRLVAAGDTPLSGLLDALPPSVTTPEIRVACDDASKFDVVARAAAHFRARWPVNEIDGMRVQFEHGWGLLRASNTQPVLVLRFEASTGEALAEYRARVEDWLRANAPEVHLDAVVGH